jgi:hypothetical protein
MNIQSNAISESPLESQVVAPAKISATRRFYWSLRRELWGTRSIYLAPAAVAALVLFGFLISTIHLPAKMRDTALEPMHQHNLIEQPYRYATALIMLSTFVVGIFYCLDGLYGERRDRSTLFWKSLPVSDLTTVLSKSSIPLVLLPLLTFAITVVAQGIMLRDRACALVGAILWLDATGFRVGAARSVSMGHITAARDQHRREKCVQHFAFHCHAAVPLERQPGSCYGAGDAPD